MSKEVQHCYCQTQTTVEEKFKLKKIVKRDFLLVLLYVLAILFYLICSLILQRRY